MKHATAFFGLLGLLAGLALQSACTDVFVYNEVRDNQRPTDRTLRIEGEFCTPSSNDIVRPIKVLVAIDASQSMATNDKDNTRATAVAELIRNLPNEPEVYFSTLLFAGSTSTWLTKSGTATFDPITMYDDLELQILQAKILSPPNRDSTDFVKPLSDIYALINGDIAAQRISMNSATARSRYSVIFLTDGQPTEVQDDQLLCGDTVRRIRLLKELTEDVQVNFVHVRNTEQPLDSTKCGDDAGANNTPISGGTSCRIPLYPPEACPLLIVNSNVERLKRMSQLGGGEFRDFRNNEPINFLNFRFGNVRRSFIFDKLIVSNFSAPAGSPDGVADTDSDGLLDVVADNQVGDEDKARTLPWIADTDGDGFSDGVEVYFSGIRSRGIAGRGLDLVPNQVATLDGGGLDKGCPPELRGVDSDCDGLTDCDEQLISTNAKLADSDDDGVPDSVEFKLGTQPSSKDLDDDPDNDGLLNRQELEMHMDPVVADSANLSTYGYRYQVNKLGGVNSKGEQCYSFQVDNVVLANTAPDTRDAGNPDGGDDLFARRGAGFNDIFVSFSVRPNDDPDGRTTVKTYRHTTSRYPVGGIKSPVDGVIHIAPDDFNLGCGPAAVQNP